MLRLLAALSSLPALIGGEVAEGPLGSALFGGIPSVTGSALSSGPGSSNTSATLPDDTARDAHLLDVRHIEDSYYEIDVYSPAMDQVVTNDLLLPAGDEPRPTFYLMLGADGAHAGPGWPGITNYQEFFADKHVNVVTPLRSVSSLQGDWYYEDQATGTNRWATYMTAELPKIIDEHFHGTGRDAIAGPSLSGGPALTLAAHSPERFVAAASYSGCPSTLGLGGYLWSNAGVRMNDGSSTNAYGLPGNEAWAVNSPTFNVDKLVDTAVFVSTAHGVPESPFSSGGPAPVEVASYACSTYFVNEARAAGVEVDFHELVVGTHSWEQFEHQMRTSWRTIGPALGAAE